MCKLTTENVDVSDGIVNDDKFKEFCARQSVNNNVSRNKQVSIKVFVLMGVCLSFCWVHIFPDIVSRK